MIASAGIIADSTATVIGAMIVAPLMTPIVGIVYAIMVADGRNLARSFVLVGAGSAAVVLVAWAIGHLTAVDVVAETSSQVAGRIHPRLIDLLAAVATGAVGSFALVREDVSDTLPGVAIAISLVPPLGVVGLTLEAGATDQALGAFILYLTNVAAILLSGIVVMAIYRVPNFAFLAAAQLRLDRRVLAGVIVAAVVGLSVPLGAASQRFVSESLRRSDVTGVAERWATAVGWRVVRVDTSEDGVVVEVERPLPSPDPQLLRRALDLQGLEDVDVIVELLPTERVDLPGR